MTINIDNIQLAAGAHHTRDDGLCLLEAVAWVAGEAHSDHPTCTSTVLAAFGRELNDQLPDGLRQQLVPLVPRLIGTRGDGLDETRGYLALDWLIRTYTPAWLDLAGLTARDDVQMLVCGTVSPEAERSTGAINRDTLKPPSR